MARATTSAWIARYFLSRPTSNGSASQNTGAITRSPKRNSRRGPSNALGRKMMTKLKVYPGEQHPNTAQTPELRQVEA